MKDFEWRQRYAPHGYAFIKQRVSFDTLLLAVNPAETLSAEIERMRYKLFKDCPYFYNPQDAHTRISVFPKSTGESVNHLDPLKPRFGVEIEIRQPMPESMEDCQMRH